MFSVDVVGRELLSRDRKVGGVQEGYYFLGNQGSIYQDVNDIMKIGNAQTLHLLSLPAPALYSFSHGWMNPHWMTWLVGHLKDAINIAKVKLISISVYTRNGLQFKCQMLLEFASI